jgi:hypothetical protein
MTMATCTRSFFAIKFASQLKGVLNRTFAIKIASELQK